MEKLCVFQDTQEFVESWGFQFEERWIFAIPGVLLQSKIHE